MTPITKEALIERGFEETKSDLTVLTKNGQTANVVLHVELARDDGYVARLKSFDGTHQLWVPNCTTMEQVDQLITLFLK